MKQPYYDIVTTFSHTLGDGWLDAIEEGLKNPPRVVTFCVRWEYPEARLQK